jgi:1,4-dihydroxy-2-naphthoate polyprenyltransferase
MASVKNWLQAFRLRTLPLALSTVGMGIFLFLSEVSPSVKTPSLSIILLVLTTIALQILSNLANDYGDGIKGTDNENRVGPTRAVQANLITPGLMKKGVIICALISFGLGIALIYTALHEAGWNKILFFLALGIGSILAAIGYTVGKKAYGYHGLGDVFVFLFFGLVGVIGAYYLLADKFEYLLLLPATTIGLLSTAVLNMNNMRDIDNDRNSSKNTLVVLMGFEKAKIYHTSLILLGMISWFIFIYHQTNYMSYISTLPFLLLLKNVGFVVKCAQPAQLDGELKKIALSTFGVTLLYGLSLLF